MAGEGSHGRGGGVSPRQAGPRAGSAVAYSSGALLHDQPSDTALLYAHRWWEVPLHPRGQGSGKWAQPYALEGSVCLVLMAPTGWGQPLGAQSRLCSQGTHTWVPGLQVQAPGGDACSSHTCPLLRKTMGLWQEQTSMHPSLAALSLGWDRAHRWRMCWSYYLKWQLS